MACDAGCIEEHGSFPAWDVRAYDYNLPAQAIAQHPARERDVSRLLVYHRSSERLSHHRFHALPELLVPGDVLVLNDCRVMPARLQARRADTGTPVELLLTEQLHDVTWRAMVKPGRSCRPGVRLAVGGTAADVAAVASDGQRTIRFDCTPEEVAALIETHGAMPLPPYIHRERGTDLPEDRERYQTVYAAHGSAVAAPTAGLHFTTALLDRLRERGVLIETLTLDVGAGTFLPVKSGDVRRHHMHAEHFVLPGGTAAALNAAREGGARIVAVGTTSLRVLETCIDAEGRFGAQAGATALFIHPPYSIRSIDGLITNFHLPRSTLLMLVAAWLGEDRWRRIYSAAMEAGYRFYSYGDATLLW